MITADFWRKICPDLNIGAVFPPSRARAKVDPAEVLRQRERLAAGGTARFENVFAPSHVNKLRKGAVALKDHGFLPLLLSLFDEFWDTIAALQPIGRGLLGEDYVIRPDYWIWHEEPIAKKMSHGLLLWISLSESAPGLVVSGNPGPSAEFRKCGLFVHLNPLSLTSEDPMNLKSGQIPTFQERSQLVAAQLLRSAGTNLCAKPIS